MDEEQEAEAQPNIKVLNPASTTSSLQKIERASLESAVDKDDEQYVEETPHTIGQMPDFNIDSNEIQVRQM